MITVVVKWKGPYEWEDVCKSESRNGIYLITGKQPRQRKERIQYCGITENKFSARLRQKGHAREAIRSATLEIWLGEIVYPDEFDKSHLGIAEHCFVSFWQPPLNRNLIRYVPSQAVCLISEWFFPDDSARRERPDIIADLPDVLWWDEERWRTGQLDVNPAL